MLRIMFVNWRDYLLRGDLVNVQWIRIPTNITIARQLHGLPSHTKWLLVYFLSEAGLQNENGKLDIEIDYVSHYSGCTFAQILDSAMALSKRGYFSLDVDEDTLRLVEEAKRAEETRTRAESAQTRAEETRTRAESAQTNFNEQHINLETLPSAYDFKYPESLEFKESAQTRAESAQTRAEETRTRAESAPREEKRREEKKREEERKGESLREPIFDAADGGSLSLANSGSKKSKTQKVQVMDLSDAELELGTDWLKLAVTHFPHKATDPKWNPSEFALELRKVANVIGLSIAQMRDLLEWVKADTFWCNKVASPYGLLKKSTNGLRKIENALASSKSKAQIKNAQIQADWEENPEKKKAYELAMSIMRGGKP